MTIASITTHARIDPGLCGTPTVIGPGHAEVRLRTTPVMAADEQGLCHGGFVFGAVDYAAMLAVGDPNVVLGSAQVKFLRPLRVGEELVARARCTAEQGKKRIVAVEAVRVGGELLLTGEMVCLVLPEHVLVSNAKE